MATLLIYIFNNTLLLLTTSSDVILKRCDKTKVNKGAHDAHDACNYECLSIQISINEYYELYPECKPVKYLYGKCGSVDEGRCGYYSQASISPTCFCYTPSGSNKKRSSSLYICSLGLPFVRTLTNVSFGLSSCATGSTARPQTGKVGQERLGEDDGEEEGSLLVADMYISGTKIRALLDTGSGVTLIPYKFAKEVVNLDTEADIEGLTEDIQMVGKTTIDLQIKSGVIIPVTGLAAGTHFDILIGNDFFVKHGAVLNLSGRKMELSVYRNRIEIPIKFRQPFFPGTVAAVGPDPGGYSSLTIAAVLNGRETEIMIDTGASNSIVRKDYLNPESIEPLELRSKAPDGRDVEFKGKARYEFTVGQYGFRGQGLVADFDYAFSLITGNSWNKLYVDLIDFQQTIIILKYPNTNYRVMTPAIITRTMPPTQPKNGP